MNYKVYCTECGKPYDPSEPRWKCDCGGLLQIVILSKIKYKNFESEKPIFEKYKEAIPINNWDNLVSFGEYQTPIVEINDSLVFKLDFIFPSGSFKDRGAAILISKMKEWGVKEIVEDSSGNAGCAIAAYANLASIKSHICLPESTEAGKIKQLKSYHPHLHFISGKRENAAKEALRLSEKMMYASHVWQPYFIHGVKTIAYEIFFQSKCHLPDKIYVPVGNGTLLIGLYIGFCELKEAGLLTVLPKLIAIQAQAFASLYHSSREVHQKETVAQGIAISKPLRKNEMKIAISESNGYAMVVTEDEILSAWEELSKNGLYVEPTAAVGLAGYQNDIREDKNKKLAMIILTGSGLKN